MSGQRLLLNLTVSSNSRGIEATGKNAGEANISPTKDAGRGGPSSARSDQGPSAQPPQPPARGDEALRDAARPAYR